MKTYWNYRVIKMPDKKLKNLPQTYSWGVYEVYYNFVNDKPHSWSAEPIHPIGESWNVLMENYQYMFRAFTKPTLELKGKKLVEIGRFK